MELTSRWRMCVGCSCTAVSFERQIHRTYLRESVPIFALVEDLERDLRFKQLRVVGGSACDGSVKRPYSHGLYHEPILCCQSLRADESPEVELRVSSRTKGVSHKAEWVGVGELPAATMSKETECLNPESNCAANGVQALVCDHKDPGTSSVTEIVRYRSAITNTGCGVVAVRSTRCRVTSTAD